MTETRRNETRKELPMLQVAFDENNVEKAVELVGYDVKSAKIVDGNLQVCCDSCGSLLTTRNLGHILPIQKRWFLYCSEPSCLSDYIGRHI